MDALIAFFTSVMNAEFDFSILGQFFGGYIWTVTNNAELLGMWNAFFSAIAPYAYVVPIVLIVLCAIVIFFGKKLVPLIRFLACIVVGYVVGVITVSPLINQIFVLPNYVSGIVIAIVAGVLAKFIYYIGIVLGVGYISYMVCFRAAIVPALTNYTKGNAIASLIVALIAIVLVLLLRKLIEMGATAFAGAFFISEIVIANYFNYTTVIAVDPVIVKYVAVGIVALVGFIVQYKTRKRY